MSLTACGSHSASTTAPAFRLPDVRDPSRSVSLTQFGGKPVVVNFFGAWCVPCRAELPLLESTHRGLHGRAAFVGIDTTDSRTEAIALLDQTHVTYPAAYDPKGTLKGRYGVRAMPTTVFVRADGTVAETVAGQLTAGTLAKGLHAAGAT
jgi:thiol-disulfide isomerase/thioredoxin